MLLAVLTLGQIRTAGVSAWFLALPRHSHHLQMQKPQALLHLRFFPYLSIIQFITFCCASQYFSQKSARIAHLFFQKLIQSCNSLVFDVVNCSSGTVKLLGDSSGAFVMKVHTLNNSTFFQRKFLDSINKCSFCINISVNISIDFLLSINDFCNDNANLVRQMRR